MGLAVNLIGFPSDPEPFSAQAFPDDALTQIEKSQASIRPHGAAPAAAFLFSSYGLVLAQGMARVAKRKGCPLVH
jgi:hypothetical protein